MNSFKKISLVLAAALASTVLGTATAQAVPTIAVSVSTVADTDANTLAGAAVVTVPSDNKVDAADAVKFALTGVDTGTVVSVVTSGALIVPALWASTAPVTSASGVTSYSVNTGTGTTAEFYVYTKSTATGTVTITNGGNTYVYYVKGTAGPAYNISPVVALSANTSSVVEYSTTVTDIFGNVPAGTTPVVTVVGATVSVSSGSSDASGISKVSVTYPVTAGNAAIGFAITATDVDGLPVAVKSVTKFVTVSDLATSNASLTAQLAASVAARAADATAAAAAATAAKAVADATLATATAALATANASLAKATADAALVKAAADKALADAKAAADSATVTAKVASDLATATAAAKYKAEYNALATKWNKKNPKAKVTLKK
jgi:hypothetical protein